MYAIQYLLKFFNDVKGIQNNPLFLERLCLARIRYPSVRFVAYPH